MRYHINILFKLLFLLFFLTIVSTAFAFNDNPFTYDLKEQAVYYSKKKIDPITGIPHFSKEYKVSKKECTAYEICYKVFIFGEKIEKIEHIVNTHVVNKYHYKYDENRLIEEKFYDNQRLIYIKKFIYHQNGKISKIEEYDRNGKDPFGDWIFFNEDGDITKRERYRDKKLSYEENYRNGKIYETKYFQDVNTYITRFDENGKVILEKKLNEFEDSKVSTIKKNKELLEFKIDTINQIQINNDLVQIMIKKKNKKWIAFKTWFKKQNKKQLIDHQSAIYDADPEKVKSFIHDIERLKVFKILQSKHIDMKKYGISKSKQKIILKTTTDREHHIIIGNLQESSNAYYVYSNHLNKDIGLIHSDRIRYILNQEINNFRPKEFLSLRADQILSYQFDNLIFNNSKGKWICKNSEKQNSKQSRIIIETLLKLRALEFIDDSEKIKTILDQSNKNHTIKITMKDSEIVLEIYKNKSDIYAKTNIHDTLYKIPGYVMIFLEKKKKYFE